AVRPGEDGRQAPNRYARRPSFHGGGLAVLVEELPGRVAAAVPAHAFGPDEKGVALVVGGQDGVLSVTATARRRVLARSWIAGNEGDLTRGLPCGKNVAAAFRQREAAHGAGADLPLAEVLRLEAGAVILGHEQI